MNKPASAKTSVMTSIVVPAHNEVDGISSTIAELSNVLHQFGPSWEVIIVDDGSTDNTFDKVAELSSNDARIRCIRFSRNFGKEAAILAGLRYAKGQRVITIDADLQHPPSLIPEMIAAWEGGAKIVNAVKEDRATDSTIARLRARIFNTIVSRLGGVDLHDSSDYKLLDRSVVDALARQLPERERFYRGLADWLGFQSADLPFSVESRMEGSGKWSVWKLAELALTALVSFTSAPLRIVTVLGILTMVLGVVIALEATISWARGEAVSGFATIIITLLIIGSFVMISLGIIGEYIAKIYTEVKNRPPYLVEKVTDGTARDDQVSR